MLCEWLWCGEWHGALSECAVKADCFTEHASSMRMALRRLRPLSSANEVANAERHAVHTNKILSSV